MIYELEVMFYDLHKGGKLTPDTVRLTLSTDDKESGMKLSELLAYVKSKYAGLMQVKHYDVAVNKVHEVKPGIYIGDITPQFLLAFERYMIVEMKNIQSTVFTTMKDLKALFNKGIKQKVISHNPFDEYKVKKAPEKQRQYLLEDEVKKIEAYADNEDKMLPLRKVAAWFVLSCYSGMRLSDLNVWNESEMVKGDKLYFSDVKTRNPHFIPIHADLKRAIERVRNYDKLPVGQVVNRYLKEICASDSVRIKTHVTMHVGRHTFAVNYLERGGRLQILQKLLGHKKISVTAIYGQITDKSIEDEMKNVWG